MSERSRTLLQAAAVAAVVGTASSLLVGTCTRGPKGPTATMPHVPPTATAPPPVEQAPAPPTPEVYPPAPPQPPPEAPITELDAGDAGDADATALAAAEPLDAGLDAGPTDAEANAQEELDAAPPPPPRPPPVTATLPPNSDAIWSAQLRSSSEGFEAGAGPFLTEPPLWGAWSAFVNDIEAGAGTFTEPSTFGASAFPSNPQAGAGPFTTDRSAVQP